MTNFTIEQIIALSQAGFSADQINGFAMGQQAPVQQTPVQQVPVQQVPVQQVPVQQAPVQQTPAQQIPEIPSNQAPGGDISGQLLTLIKTIQAQNLANASGQTPTAQTAEDIGLSILGKTGGEN